MSKFDENIVENNELSLWEALIPVVVLVSLLFYNIIFKDGEWIGGYSNQYILLFGGLVAAIVGLLNKSSISVIGKEIINNLKSVLTPIIILLLVGALTGTWLFSGVIPAMVYYGLQILSPSIFLPASIIISIVISLATGSSWTTTATVGIALIGIGSTLGINPGMIAGAVISGAYFGDKMSPLSDTTNLAPAMAGTDLFTHIKYMTITTIPTILITIIIFTILGFTQTANGNAEESILLEIMEKTFNITPWLFLVPLVVIILIVFKIKPILSLSVGIILAIVFAFVFQSDLLTNYNSSSLTTVFEMVVKETTLFENIEIVNDKLNIGENITIVSSDLSNYTAIQAAEFVENLQQLLSAKGILGMLWTIALILSAMVFGGAMDGIGALARITKELLSLAKSVFGLFLTTVASCLGLNFIASDQYLALVVPGKMFKQAYEDRGLAPENLSRTLEDSGTVTSVLVPWNTCGAYQSTTLGVSVSEYFVFAIFNWLSPIVTLIVAGLGIKIRQKVKA